MSQLVGDARPTAILEANDDRLLSPRWRRVHNTESRDLRWPRSRLDGAQGWIEATWYEWPTQRSGFGVAVLQWSYTMTPTVGGTIYSRPRLTVQLPFGIDYGITRLRWLNASTGQAITVERTFVSGETLTIDSDAFTVEVGGSQVDFSGTFPLLDPREGATNTFLLYAWAADTPTLTPVIDWTSRFAA